MVAKIIKLREHLLLIHRLIRTTGGLVYGLLFDNWPNNNDESPWSLAKWVGDGRSAMTPLGTRWDGGGCSMAHWDKMTGHAQMLFTQKMDLPWWKKIFGIPVVVTVVYQNNNSDVYTALISHGNIHSRLVRVHYRLFRRGNILVLINWELFKRNKFLVAGCDGSVMAIFSIYPVAMSLSIVEYRGWKFETQNTQA